MNTPKEIKISNLESIKIFNDVLESIFVKNIDGMLFYFESESKKVTLLYMNGKDFSLNKVEDVFKKIENQISCLVSVCKIKIVFHKKHSDSVEKIISFFKINPIKNIQKNQNFDFIFQPESLSLKISDSLEKKSESSFVNLKEKNKIKVLIVDDSKTIRQLLTNILSNDPQIQVIGAAEKPSEVEKLIQEKKPDVITLDIHMPEMDGVTLLKQLLPKYKIPTIMISSISREEGPLVLNALEAGAVDYIQKPSMKDLDITSLKIIESVKTAFSAKVVETPQYFFQQIISNDIDTNALIVIGSSTGGTEALRVVLQSLPENIPPILIVQHIPAVFSAALAARLDSLCKFKVQEARDGDVISPGLVLIAPGGKQMGIAKKSGKLVVTVNEDAPVNRHKPSVDYLFNKLADLNLTKVVGCILTGMGADGAKGLLRLKQNGAQTIAQDKDSCVVFGMPREAIELGAANFITPLNRIAEKLIQLCSQQSEQRVKKTGS